MNQKRKVIWVPIEILSDTKLDLVNKIIHSEIFSLCKLPQGCTASDNHFANLVGINRPAVNKRISKLKSLGYIETNKVYEGKQCLGRIIVKK